MELCVLDELFMHKSSQFFKNNDFLLQNWRKFHIFAGSKIIGINQLKL